MHSVYFGRVVVNVIFYVTVLQHLVVIQPKNQHTEGEGVGGGHKGQFTYDVSHQV